MSLQAVADNRSSIRKKAGSFHPKDRWQTLNRRGQIDWFQRLAFSIVTCRMISVRRVLVSIGWALLILTILTKPCFGDFAAAKPFATSTLITTIIVADLNEDGVPDLVGGDANETELNVLLGRAHGRFGEFTTFPAGAGVTQLTSGDFDGDGHIDVATTDGVSAVNILFGAGDGGFAAPTAIEVHANPQGIRTADLDCDGHFDLVVAIAGADGQHDGDLAVMVGKGDGIFAAPIYYRAGQDPKGLALADLNGDGKIDAAVADETCCGRNSLSVLLGNGDGTFQHAVSSIPGSTSDVAAGDLNRDGKQDLVLASESDELIQVALGNGDGTFQSPTTYPMPDPAYNVTVGDINNDGLLDLAVSGIYQVSVLLGKGDGSFEPAQGYGVGSYFVALADLNGDQVLDAVAGRYNLVAVAMGNPQKIFNAALTVSVVGGGIRRAASGDFNNDGISDVVAVLNKVGSPNTVRIFLADGQGGLAPGAAFSEDPQGFVTTGDFNNDSNLDLSTSSDTGGGGICIFLGNGDGTFQAAKKNISTIPFFQTTGDFNGDGNLDIASTGNFSTTVQVLLGHGDGFFDPAVNLPNGNSVQGLTSADFDLDGNLDIAVATSHGISVYAGNGDGTFQPAVETNAFRSIELASGDFNGDGRPDLVDRREIETTILLGNGDFTFRIARFWHAHGPIAVADFNGDGNLDVTVADDGFARVALGNGNGTFRPIRSYFTGIQVSTLMVFGNLNRNPLPELVIPFGENLQVLFNSGSW